MTDDTEIRHGTANVFADLHIPDPETHLLKARFVARMIAIVRDKNLTQTQAPASWASANPTYPGSSRANSATCRSSASCAC